MAVDLKIPKRQVKVEILLVDTLIGDEDFVLYLSERSAHHQGEETVGEYLNTFTQFLPVKHCASNLFYLINFNQILYVREKETREPEPKQKLTIHFHNELAINVELFEVLPQFHARPIDVFNRTERFLTFSEQKRLIHVNKTNIIRVTGI